MDSVKETLSFNPYKYEGSPNVSLFEGNVATAFGLLFFSAINYAAVRIGPPNKMTRDVWRWRNTFVSWIHADIVGVGVLYCLYFKPEIFSDMIIYCDHFIYTLVAFSQGYFVYDFIDHVVNNKLFSNYEVILHHIAVLWSFGYNIQYRVNLPYSIIALMTEVNSIFLHARKLMHFDQYPADHWLYRMVVALNLVTFVCFRIWGIILIGRAIVLEWQRLTLVYQIFIIMSMFIMYVINPILLWRLFKTDIIRNWWQKASKVSANGSHNLLDLRPAEKTVK